MDKDAAYTAGIMHDIGRLALVVIRPAKYTALLGKYSGSSSSLLHEERELFGFDRCEAGQNLIQDWKLPSEFEAPHRPASRPQEIGRPLANRRSD